jgi:hypothetical protein
MEKKLIKMGISRPEQLGFNWKMSSWCINSGQNKNFGLQVQVHSQQYKSAEYTSAAPCPHWRPCTVLASDRRNSRFAPSCPCLGTFRTTPKGTKLQTFTLPPEIYFKRWKQVPKNNGTSPEKKKLCPTRGTGGNQQPLHPMPRCHRSPPVVFGHKRPSQRWAWGESTSTFPATMENVWKMYGWLVVSTPLKNFSKLGWLFHILWKNKIHVPNHQPDWRCIASIHPCVRFQGPGPVWKDVRACSTLPSSAFRKSVGLSENLGHRSHYPLVI